MCTVSNATFRRISTRSEPIRAATADDPTLSFCDTSAVFSLAIAAVDDVALTTARGSIQNFSRMACCSARRIPLRPITVCRSAGVPAGQLTRNTYTRSSRRVPTALSSISILPNSATRRGGCTWRGPAVPLARPERAAAGRWS